MVEEEVQEFSRNIPIAERTFALRAFNEHETEINRHYWSFQVSSEFSSYHARKEKKTDPSSSTAGVFQASGPDARRIPKTVTEWLDAKDDLENWLRLSATVSASAYLETYMRQVVRCALMSSPLCRYGAQQSLDGTVLLKSGKELPFKWEVESVTSNTWPARAEAFKSLFGSVPTLLTNNLNIMERIRKLRNNFAHGFGRDLDALPPSNSSSGRSDRLSATVFIKYIGVISKVAASIDKLLLTEFIGNFEYVYFYHCWRTREREGKEATYTESRALQHAFNQDAKRSLGPKFCQGLIAFYAKQ